MAEVTIHSDFGGQESKMIHSQGKIEKLLTITTVCEDSLIFSISFIDLPSFHVILMWQVWDLTLRTTVLDHCKPGYTTESPREALRIPWLVVPDQLNQNISVGGFWA